MLIKFRICSKYQRRIQLRIVEYAKRKVITSGLVRMWLRSIIKTIQAIREIITTREKGRPKLVLKVHNVN